MAARCHTPSTQRQNVSNHLTSKRASSHRKPASSENCWIQIFRTDIRTNSLPCSLDVWRCARSPKLRTPIEPLRPPTAPPPSPSPARGFCPAGSAPFRRFLELCGAEQELLYGSRHFTLRSDNRFLKQDQHDAVFYADVQGGHRPEPGDRAVLRGHAHRNARSPPALLLRCSQRSRPPQAEVVVIAVAFKSCGTVSAGERAWRVFVQRVSDIERMPHHTVLWFVLSSARGRGAQP
eukprot:733054-Rhodomonas_salina.2